MGKFGYSLPPGCSTLPGEEQVTCEVCGGDPELDCPDQPGSCICPECTRCGQFGNPHCYDATLGGHPTDGYHGLVRTEAQAKQLRVMEQMWEDENDIDPDTIDPSDSILD